MNALNFHLQFPYRVAEPLNLLRDFGILRLGRSAKERKQKESHTYHIFRVTKGSMATPVFAPNFLTIFNRYRDRGGPLQAFPSPADWRDEWIYFLIVDRFNNSQAAPRHSPFDDPKYFDFQGGNLASVQDRLPYIKGLGAGAIWLIPVLKNVPFQGSTYHGYGIHDFLHVDPRVARDSQHADDELCSLVDAAHKLGMYVILDIVLNHTGDVFAYVCDPGEADCSGSV